MFNSEYVRSTFNFTPENGIPCYLQLASYFRTQIQGGIFKPSDKMPSEEELCDCLGISRTTVRQALGLLVAEGILVRYRGKGSFVAEKKIERNLNHLYNFTDSIKSLNSIPSSVVLRCEVISAPTQMRDKLKLPLQNTNIFYLERLRCADGVPLLKEATCIPYFLCPRIEEFDFASTSLYNTLKNNYRLSLGYASETIGAVIISSEDSKKLNCPKGLAGFRMERLSYLDNGIVFEYTSSVTRSDKCEFQLNLYSNQKNNSNSVDFMRKLSP